MAQKYFEDLTVGERLNCQPVLMTRDGIIDFARRFDPWSFHTDEDAAYESIFGGIIASSLHTISACTRVIVKALEDVAVLSGVGIDEVKMFNPVRPGDILSVEAWCADLRRSRSNPDRGFVSIKCRATNQVGESIVEYGYRYLVACKNSS